MKAAEGQLLAHDGGDDGDDLKELAALLEEAEVVRGMAADWWIQNYHRERSHYRSPRHPCCLAAQE